MRAKRGVDNAQMQVIYGRLRYLLKLSMYRLPSYSSNVGFKKVCSCWNKLLIDIPIIKQCPVVYATWISNPHHWSSSHVKFQNETKIKQNVDDHPSNNSAKFGFNGSTGS
jgi:hypothetical protein